MSSFRRPEGKRGALNAPHTLAGPPNAPGSSSSSAATGSASSHATTAIRRQHCTSSGLRELDRIVGGGIPFGSVMLIGEDQHSYHASTILNYSIAEAICQRHDVLIITAPGENVLSRLPFELSQESESKNKAEIAPTASAGGEQLKIAWQYGKYLNESTDPSKKGHFAPLRPPASSAASGGGTGGAMEFCHSYDLARSLQRSVIASANVEIFSPSIDGSGPCPLRLYLEHVWDKLRTRVAAKLAEAERVPGLRIAGAGGAIRPLRVFLPGLAGVDRLCPLSDLEGFADLQFILRFILQVRHLVRDRDNEITVAITTDARVHAPQTYFPRMAHMSDLVFEVESFDGRRGSIPSEYKEFCAFFLVRKLSNNYVLTPHHAVADQFGIKRSGRKLLIELLHLPPEEASEASAGHGHSCSAGISDILS